MTVGGPDFKSLELVLTGWQNFRERLLSVTPACIVRLLRTGLREEQRKLDLLDVHSSYVPFELLPYLVSQLLEQGRHEEAHWLIRQIHDICFRIHVSGEPIHSDLAEVFHTLARNCEAQGRVAEAEPLHHLADFYRIVALKHPRSRKRRIASGMRGALASAGVEWIALTSFLLAALSFWSGLTWQAAGVVVSASTFAILAARVVALLWQGNLERSHLAHDADALIEAIDRKLAAKADEPGSAA
ncbi:MAG: hypothetical protein EXQ95_13585 [Alphaproteobacteria bacterium]|nr:hypothetical protein [Alphaproteobacteria bacterium]